MSSATYPSSPNPPHTENYASPPITIILTVTLLVFFFVGFFSVYFCRCFMENIVNTWQLRQSPSGNNVAAASTAPINPGLDPSLIQAFPTFAYSTVKDLRREKYGLECAICLAEFEDDNILRLITVCCHVFHRECIDLWLQSHKTCPVCRSDLDLSQNSMQKSPLLFRSNSMNNNNNNNNVTGSGSNVSILEDAVSIFIKEDDNEEGREESDGGDEQVVNPNTVKQNKIYEKIERFSRSHSTGHSLPRTSCHCKEEDRHTLRLPENVRLRILRGHNWTGSCITFGEFSSPAVITRNNNNNAGSV